MAPPHIIFKIVCGGFVLSKKLIVALLCLIIAVITLLSKREDTSLHSAGERLVSAMMGNDGAVAVFNMDRGAFV